MNRASFDAVKASGLLVEHFYPSTVVITCPSCGRRWARDRRGARADTVRDRAEAADHAPSCLKGTPS